MMGRFFSWSMQTGPKILFWSAILTLFANTAGQFWAIIRSVRTMAQDHYSGVFPGMEFDQLLMALGAALYAPGILFFGALVIDRMDHWLSMRETGK